MKLGEPTPQAIRVIGDELAAPPDSDGVGHVVRLIEVPCGRVRKFQAVMDPLGVPVDYVWVKGPAAAASKLLAAPPIDAAYVHQRLDPIVQNEDLSRYIL